MIADPPRAEPGRRERKRQRTADHLATTAFGLFEEHGYDVVTMEQIAATGDVAKATLYNYFPVKEALLAHQFRSEIISGMKPLWPALKRQPSFAARMKHLLHASAAWNETRRDYIPHFLRFQMTTATHDRNCPRHEPSGARQIFETLFRAGQEAGEVRAHLPAAQLAVMLECMCLGAIILWLNVPNRDLKREFDFALELLLHGITAPQLKRKKK